MPIHEPLDLFLHDLGAMYDAEQRMTSMLPVLASECQDSQVKASLEHHLEETRQQIHNLEECFRAVGTPVQSRECAAVRGLEQEHDSFLQESPPEYLRQVFDLGGAAKSEAFEIVSYHGLITKAADLGQNDCVELLKANLMQEQAMLARLQQLSRQLEQRMRPEQDTEPIPETQPMSEPAASPDPMPEPPPAPQMAGPG